MPDIQRVHVGADRDAHLPRSPLQRGGGDPWTFGTEHDSESITVPKFKEVIDAEPEGPDERPDVVEKPESKPEETSVAHLIRAMSA